MKKKLVRNFLAVSSLLFVPVLVTACSHPTGGMSSTSIGNIAFQGKGAPENSIGNDGDTYTDTDTGNTYRKENGTWVLITNRNPVSYSGEGAPSDDMGVNGDTYTDLVNGARYEKRDGHWVVTREGDETYVVTFNLNGGRLADGSTSIPNQVVRDGYWITEPAVQPIKDHCTFKGWFAKGSSTPWNFVGTAVRGNVDLIAQYDVNEDSKIKIEIDPNNGQPTYVVETFVGDKLYPTVPENPGYDFVGWYVESTGAKYNGVVTKDLSGETLIAMWEEAKFNVAYQVEANDEITITGVLDIEAVTITIPNTINGRKVTKISSRAFNSRVYIESINIPANVKTIEDGAFRGTMRLQNINVDSNNAYYTAQGGILYTKNMDTLVCYPTKGAATFTLPATIKHIGAYAFYSSKDMGISTIYFNEGLEDIGDYAFYLNENITNLQFPSTLKRIGKAAFYGNISSDDEDSYILPQGVITNVTFNEGLEVIGEMAFANQYFKDVFTLPSTVTTLEDYAFVNCTAITKFILPKSLVNWGNNVFAGCTGIRSLGIDEGNTAFKVVDNILYTKDMKKLIMCPSGRTDEVTIPEGVTELADYAFYMVDELQQYNFPSTLKKFGYECFAHTYGLKSFTIPNSVTEIGKNCFDLSGIGSITIGTGLTEIPEDAFIETKLSSVSIPGNVKTIGEGAFSLCYNLSNLTLAEGLQHIGNASFFSTKISKLDMPNSLKTIGENAFSKANITALNIKDGLESIGNGAFAKDNSVSITSITVSSGNQKFKTSDNILYSKDNKIVYFAASTAGTKTSEGVVVNIPEGVEKIYDYAFAYIKTITTMNLPNSLIEIGEGAFYNTKFTSVNFGKNLKTIGEGAFASGYLKDVNFSEGLEEIGDYAFYMSDVAEIKLPNSLKVLGEYSFSKCIYLTKLELGTGIETIKPFALSDNRITGFIKIPAKCTSIGEGAFSSTVSTYGQTIQGWTVDVNNPYYSTDGDFLMNKNQTVIIATGGATANKVKIPSTVKEIANYGLACAGAKNIITGVEIPSSVEKIGEYGMAYLAGVSSCKIPATVKYIDQYAFSDWNSNQSLRFEVSRDVAYSTFNAGFLTRCNAKVTFGA